MSNQNEHILSAIRNIQWEQAKANLRSMLHTYYGQWDGKNQKIENDFDLMAAKIELFIQDIDGDM